jgi:hypothetical protein
MADLDRDTNPDRTGHTSRTSTGPDDNRDPISGAPGAHPVGVGVGAAGGGAAGAAAGAAMGAAAGAISTGPAAPIGAVIGTVVGAIAGGLAGKGVAEAVNPTTEDAFWRENYKTRPYAAASDASYTYEEDYRPAYRYGWEARGRHAGKRFEDVESDLGRDWDRTKDKSRLGWDRAKEATRDAWHRVERAMPGDFDRDGR